MCGVGMLAFQVLLYPRMSKWMGVTKTQRTACLLAIPVYLTVPLLSHLRDSEVPLIVASVIFNFLNNVTATAVSSDSGSENSISYSSGEVSIVGLCKETNETHRCGQLWV